MKVLILVAIVQSLDLVVFAWFHRVAGLRILVLQQQLTLYKRKVKEPVLAKFVRWHNHGRVQEGLNGIPDPDPALTGPKPLGGRLVAIPVLNGFHYDYRMAA